MSMQSQAHIVTARTMLHGQTRNMTYAMGKAETVVSSYGGDGSHLMLVLVMQYKPLLVLSLARKIMGLSLTHPQ